MGSDINHQREIIHEQIAKFSYEVNYKEVLIEKLSSQWHRVDEITISQRAKMWSEVRGQIVLIRRQVDALLEDMEYFGEFDPETIREQFRQVQDDYAKINSKLENDILLNQKLRKEARGYVDELLGDSFQRDE